MVNPAFSGKLRRIHGGHVPIFVSIVVSIIIPIVFDEDRDEDREEDAGRRRSGQGSRQRLVAAVGRSGIEAGRK